MYLSAVINPLPPPAKVLHDLPPPYFSNLVSAQDREQHCSLYSKGEGGRWI